MFPYQPQSSLPGHMPDSMYSDLSLLLLRDLNFFPSLDPNQSNLSLASDQSPDECPLTEVITDCLSSLFGKWVWHGPGDCDVDCPQVAANVSDSHLNTCLIEVPLQDTLQNQTVRVTDYCIGSILTHTYMVISRCINSSVSPRLVYIV